MAKFKKLQRCEIMIDPDIWEYIKSLSKQRDVKMHTISASEIVRRCIKHCMDKDVIVKLSERKE